jgi:hypothetical protein
MEVAPKQLASEHESFLLDFVKKLGDDLEKKYRTVLETAIRDKPENPDRAIWQLSLADMLAHSGGDAAQIRDLLSAAQKGLSTDGKKNHESQIRRIEQSLKARK